MPSLSVEARRRAQKNGERLTDEWVALRKQQLQKKQEEEDRNNKVEYHSLDLYLDD